MDGDGDTIVHAEVVTVVSHVDDCVNRASLALLHHVFHVVVVRVAHVPVPAIDNGTTR